MNLKNGRNSLNMIKLKGLYKKQNSKAHKQNAEQPSDVPVSGGFCCSKSARERERYCCQKKKLGSILWILPQTTILQLFLSMWTFQWEVLLQGLQRNLPIPTRLFPGIYTSLALCKAPTNSLGCLLFDLLLKMLSFFHFAWDDPSYKDISSFWSLQDHLFWRQSHPLLLLHDFPDSLSPSSNSLVFRSLPSCRVPLDPPCGINLNVLLLSQFSTTSLVLKATNLPDVVGTPKWTVLARLRPIWTKNIVRQIKLLYSWEYLRPPVRVWAAYSQ